MLDKKAEILSKYLPSAAAPIISKWIDEFKCEFKISKSRNSKFGDYRPPYNGKGHKISVNYNLNTYAFLVTTVHEFAHLITWEQYKLKAKPHGAEWKLNFKKMMHPFFDLDIFPKEVNLAIKAYLNNPAASSCTDLNLYNTLKAFDKQIPGMLTIDKVSENQLFCLKNGRTFKKLEKIRKRYRCVEINTNRVYLFSPIAEVYLLKN